MTLSKNSTTGLVERLRSDIIHLLAKARKAQGCKCLNPLASETGSTKMPELPKVESFLSEAISLLGHTSALP